jgi:hypothetical protein
MKKTILALALVAGLTSFAGNAKAAFVYQPSPGFSGGGDFNIANVNNNSGGAYNSIYVDLSQAFSIPMFGVNFPSSVSISGNNYTYGPLGNQGITSVFLASANFGDLVNGSTSFGTNINLSNGNNQYVAIKLNTDTSNSGSFNYGWMSFNVSDAGIYDGFTTPTFTLTAYGYDTTGASVTVGQTTAAVPEPSTYALFGLGALALVIAYRRKTA